MNRKTRRDIAIEGEALKAYAPEPDEIEPNIYLIECTLKAWKLHQAGVPWEKAVDRAFAHNNHLFQVQTQRWLDRRLEKSWTEQHSTKVSR